MVQNPPSDANKRPIAVAVGYDATQDSAPKIAASGRGAVAEQILNIAFAHGVKVREDAPLAEILSMLEVDSLIPLEAYAAVAEILSYVYRANAQEAALQARMADREAEAHADQIVTPTVAEDDGVLPPSPRRPH